MRWCDEVVDELDSQSVGEERLVAKYAKERIMALALNAQLSTHRRRTRESIASAGLRAGHRQGIGFGSRVRLLCRRDA